MENTKIVVGGDVSGNIGSCQVNSTDVTKDWIHQETIAVNSCTGQVVADYVHIDPGSIVLGVAICAFLIIFALLNS